jgi:uncharacterized membrane protein SpoIIM required for sporulation
MPVFLITYLLKKGNKINFLSRNKKSMILRMSVIGIPSLTMMAFSVTVNLLAIPERRDTNLVISELNKELFAGAEDVTKNMKIAQKYDPVIKNALKIIFLKYFSKTPSLRVFLYWHPSICYFLIWPRSFATGGLRPT